MDKFKRITAVILTLMLLTSLCLVYADSETVSESATDYSFFDGYSLSATIGSEDSKFMPSGGRAEIVSIENWQEGKKGFSYRDNWSTQREQSAEAQIVLNVTDDQAIELCTVVSLSKEGCTYNKFFVSADGASWDEITADQTETRLYTDEIPHGYTGLVSESYIAKIERISNLPEGTVQVKITTGTTENMSWQPSIDYIDIYTPDYFDNFLYDYKYVDTLLTVDRTINDEIITDYENWTFGIKGMPFRDTYGTQRERNNNRDASITLSVSENYALEIATVVSKTYKNITTNTYYYSTDGTEWLSLPESNLFSVTEQKNENNLLLDGFFAVTDRLICPKGADYIKIITSTSDTANTWWQPSLNYIDIYYTEYGLATEGEGITVEDTRIVLDRKCTVDELTTALDIMKEGSFVYYYNSQGEEIFDGRTEIEDGFSVSVINQDAVKREYFVELSFTPESISGGFNLEKVFSVTRKGINFSVDGPVSDYIMDGDIDLFTSSNNVDWNRFDPKNIGSVLLAADDKYLKITGNSIFSMAGQQDIDCIVMSQVSGNLSLVSPTGSDIIRKKGKYITAYIDSAGMPIDSLTVATPSASAEIVFSFYKKTENNNGIACYDSETKKFTLRGDANSDTMLDARDLVRIKKFACNTEVSLDTIAADTNCDNNINATDLAWIRSYLIS